MMQNIIDNSAALGESSSTHQKNLLEMPDEVIETILGILNYDDQDSFSICCKRINKIFKTRSKFIWLRIQNSTIHDLTRPYAKVIWQCDKVPEVKEEVWSRLAATIKALKIRVMGCYYTGSETESLMAGLPHFRNIVHWKFVKRANSWFLWCLKMMPLSQLVEMEKLEHLEIDLCIFLLLKDRFIKFSTEKLLKTLILNYKCLSDNIKVDFISLKSFISRQEKLEVLRLRGAFTPIFDRTLDLENIHLKEFEFNTEMMCPYLTEVQQDNLVDFIEFQKQVGMQKYTLNAKYCSKSQKLTKFQMSHLNLPSTSLKLTIHRWLIDSAEYLEEVQRQTIRFKLYIETTSTAGNFGGLNFTEFLEFPHQENLVTEKLDVKLQRVDNDILSFLCTKFPKLKTLKIDTSNYWGIYQPIALRPLGTLALLESLELIFISFYRNHEVLSEITIPNLKKISFRLNIDTDITNVASKTNLYNFMARHQNITHLKLTPYVWFKEFPDHINGEFVIVLKFALETLKKMKFVECSLWPDSELLDDIEQTMKIHAQPGLTMKLVQFDGDYLVLTKVDANGVILRTNA